MDFFKTLIQGRKGYPPDCKKILQEHGNEQLVKIELRRYPIDKNINTLMNVIIAGHGRAVPYEKLFHLSMYAETDRNTRLLIEKNYVFHMETNPKEWDNTEKMNVPVSNPDTLENMLEKTKEQMGEGNFFNYSAKDNNCQDWTLAFLRANNLNSPVFETFVKQDVEKSMEGLNDFRKFLNSMTDTARWFDIWKQGGALSQRNGLTNIQINNLLSHIPNYRGCYSKDQIPSKLERNCWYVLNMQNSKDGDGTHWVCFKYGYPVTYYDPFGAPPPIEVMKIVKRQMIWNSKQIQDINSTACGWFCIACIISDAEMNYYDTETHFNRFIHSFSDNTITNEKILKKMINYYFT